MALAEREQSHVLPESMLMLFDPGGKRVVSHGTGRVAPQSLSASCVSPGQAKEDLEPVRPGGAITVKASGPNSSPRARPEGEQSSRFRSDDSPPLNAAVMMSV